MPSRSLTASLLLVAMLALAGCTQQTNSAEDFKGEQKKVAEVFDDLSKFATRRQGTKICEELYSDALAKEVASRDPKRSCGESLKEALADVDSNELDVTKITIEGKRASAVVESKAGDDKLAGEFSLTKVGENWRITAIGS